MSVNILLIGDPHFKVENIQEINMFLEKIIDIATEKKPDLIIILGDLLHTHERLHTIALNKAHEFVNSMRKISKTYVLVGNHDYIQNQQFLTTNHWMNSMKEWQNVVIVDYVIAEYIKDKKFIFCPYVPNGRFEEALNTLKSDTWKDANCIFAHQEFFGCKMGAIISIEGDKWDENYPFVVSGHIHEKQIPQKNIYYSGSALQHSFGDSTDNIIPFINFFDNYEYKIYEINLNLPRKKIIYINIDEIDKYIINEDSNDKIKITVKGDYNEFKSLKKSKKYKEMIDKGLKIVFKPKKIIQCIKNDDIKINTDFNQILYSIITEQNNPYLLQSYELIINDNHIDL
jgi:DNA repair exonuclease SbcCD nuclease subunit